MKLTIEFDSENEKDEEQLEVLFASHEIRCFFDEIRNEFRNITKYDSLKLDAKQADAVEKVIDKYYQVLNEHGLGELL